MSVDVQCPACRTVLRPGRALVERGGECPCPTCGTLLRMEPTHGPTPKPARPRKRQPLPDYAPIEPAAPLWILPVAVVFLVAIVGGGVMFGRWAFKPNGQAATGSSFTKADSEKIKDGMTAAQVRAILGPPTRENKNAALRDLYTRMFTGAAPDPDEPVSTMQILEWTDEHTYTIDVCFIGGRVFATTWHDGPNDPYWHADPTGAARRNR